MSPVEVLWRVVRSRTAIARGMGGGAKRALALGTQFLGGVSQALPSRDPHHTLPVAGGLWVPAPGLASLPRPQPAH